MSLAGVNYPARTVVITPDTTLGGNNPEGFKTAATISATEINKILVNGSNAVLIIRGTTGEMNSRYSTVFAQGTAASYAAQSGQHVSLTDAATSEVIYLNADLFKRVQDTSGGNSLVVYGTSNGNYETLEVVGTAATIAALFAVAIPDDSIPVVSVTAAAIPTVVTSTATEFFLRVTSGLVTDGVQLPAAIAGSRIYLQSVGGAAATITPTVGGQIDGGASIILGVSASLMLACTQTGRWASQVTQIRTFKTQGVTAIDTTAAITITTVGSGVNMEDTGAGTMRMASATGNVVMESTGGYVSARTTNGYAELLGTYARVGNLVQFISTAAATGAVTPGTPVTTAFVDVTTNPLNGGLQFTSTNGSTFHVIKNSGANPLFFWDEGGVAIRATALAVGDVAVFYKVGTAWVSDDFTPVA